MDEDLSGTCLGFLNNIARTDGSVQYVREIPKVFDVVRKFLYTDDDAAK